MDILLVLDKENKTGLSANLTNGVRLFCEKRGFDIEIAEIGQSDVRPCLGCLRCWSSGSNECVCKDMQNELKRKAASKNLIIFLTPVLFGNYSSTMKNTKDRGIVGQVGLCKTYPRQVIIDYGEDINPEEESTFRDIIEKHQGKADIVHPELKGMEIDVLVTRSLMDNQAACEFVGRLTGEGGAQ